MTKKELLEALEGEEILSIEFEGCVAVHNGKIVQGGELEPDYADQLAYR